MKLTSQAGAGTLVTLVNASAGRGDFQPAPAEGIGLSVVKYRIQGGYEYSYAESGLLQEKAVDARIIQVDDLTARALWYTLRGLIFNPAEQPFDVVFNDHVANPSFDGLWKILNAVPDFKSGFHGHIPLQLTMLRS